MSERDAGHDVVSDVGHWAIDAARKTGVPVQAARPARDPPIGINLAPAARP
ncbi:hypothetical protein [Ralstonia solanacearum]|uniref:hypothetical protein n=1 Tax=Ralstonia solanacearum TaxID=305 RepID=UPI000AEAE42D|nr:hypothetical protein [Ralstonia solanacearum]